MTSFGDLPLTYSVPSPSQVSTQQLYKQLNQGMRPRDSPGH